MNTLFKVVRAEKRVHGKVENGYIKVVSDLNGLSSLVAHNSSLHDVNFIEYVFSNFII